MYSDLQIICTWSKSFGLSINPNKSQVCVFGNYKQLSKILSPLPTIMFDNVCWKVSTSVQNLGIRMHSTFSKSPHVSKLSPNIFCAIGRLRRWKNILPLKSNISFSLYSSSTYTRLYRFMLFRCVTTSLSVLGKLESLPNLMIIYIFRLRKHDHMSHYHS